MFDSDSSTVRLTKPTLNLTLKPYDTLEAIGAAGLWRIATVVAAHNESSTTEFHDDEETEKDEDDIPKTNPWTHQIKDTWMSFARNRRVASNRPLVGWIE
jgi:hypothetical protein